jgi:hypothetical protein
MTDNRCNDGDLADILVSNAEELEPENITAQLWLINSALREIDQAISEASSVDDLHRMLLWRSHSRLAVDERDPLGLMLQAVSNEIALRRLLRSRGEEMVAAAERFANEPDDGAP